MFGEHLLSDKICFVSQRRTRFPNSGAAAALVNGAAIGSALPGFSVSGDFQPPIGGYQFAGTSSGVALGYAAGSPGASVSFGHSWCTQP